jgi:para-nitrobenzyl esterase
LFKQAYPGKNEVDLVNMDVLFRSPTLRYLEKKSAVAQAPVYSYMFSLEFSVNDGKPAWHCADIPFAFHNCDMIPYTNIDGVTDRLEEQFCGAYVNFARSGNPNHAALPHWSAFTPGNKATMVFDRETELRVDYEGKLLELLEKASPRRAAGPMPVKKDHN